ncbi:unnamed protein product [Withania somnifera]
METCLSCLIVVILLSPLASFANAEFHKHQFTVQENSFTRLCRTKNIITVNGQFPGPTLTVRNGDTLLVTVFNRARYNVTIHWYCEIFSEIRRNSSPEGDQCCTQSTTFFSVANHMLTVVGIDATYNKPFTTNVIMVGPGQTTNVILTANQSPGRYYMAARAYATVRNGQFDNTTTTAILQYTNRNSGTNSRPLLPQLPAFNDTATASAFANQLRGIPNNIRVPKQIDENLFFTVGLGLVNCTPGPRCQGPNNTRFAASMNNISFVPPRRTSLLQAYYQNIPGIYTLDFPPVPPVQFDYTGNVSRALWQPRFGTKLYKLKFGANVQIVLQDTAIFSTEDHPIHLHGYHFWVVGQGFGNFNAQTDTANFNLVDPPVRNTIDVPVGGWAVIRFVADNPGVWLFHCHIDSHLAWGLAMSFIVENGVGEKQTMEPPPPDLPQC